MKEFIWLINAKIIVQFKLETNLFLEELEPYRLYV